MSVLKFKKYWKNFFRSSEMMIKNKLYKPNKDALLVFGFQKTGSTAIAGLLAHRTNKSVTLDTHYLWSSNCDKIISGEIDLEHLLNKYSYPFSKEIIKEPQMTFLSQELATFFTMDRYIFIVRNPFDNIRSILDRLNLPGDKSKIDLKEVNPNWRSTFKNNSGKNYIDDLIDRWILANNRKDLVKNDKCILVKYEDFRKDKSNTIDSIAKQLGYPLEKGISHLVDYQFQPKGQKNINLHNFYGEKNYELIKNKCKDLISFYNY